MRTRSALPILFALLPLVAPHVSAGPSSSLPPPPAPEMLGLLGVYGPQAGDVLVYERAGHLYAQFAGARSLRLRADSADVWLPDGWLRRRAPRRLAFSRDSQGRATLVTADGTALARRDDGAQALQRIRALIKLDPGLIERAKAATPPAEHGTFRPAQLVFLPAVDPGIRLDVRYATERNFLGMPVYACAAAFMQRPAAEALARVHRYLHRFGFGLTVHDAYRPWHVTRAFWDATPAQGKMFVADPAEGSRHNRGAAVDITLHDLATGEIVAMPGEYDEMSARSFASYRGGTSQQRWRRDLLRRAMQREGFAVYEHEWWHFDYREWRTYAVADVDFSELPGAPPGCASGARRDVREDRN